VYFVLGVGFFSVLFWFWFLWCFSFVGLCFFCNRFLLFVLVFVGVVCVGVWCLLGFVVCFWLLSFPFSLVLGLLLCGWCVGFFGVCDWGWCCGVGVSVGGGVVVGFGVCVFIAWCFVLFLWWG